MATIKESYQGSATAFTLLLAALANFAAQESAAIDNTGNLYLDYMLTLAIKMGAAAAKGNMYVLLAPSADGAIYPSPAAGASGAITINQIDMLGSLKPGDKVPGTNLIFVDKIYCNGQPAASTVDWSLPSVAALLGGGYGFPQKFTVIVVNCTGQALDGTEANHTKNWTGIVQTAA